MHPSAARSCVLREDDDEILVAEKEGLIIGFGARRRNSQEKCEFVCSAWPPSGQRQGVYRTLLLEALMLFKSKGANRMIISAQITNIPVQKVQARVGFEISDVYHTFHKWFDE